MRYKVITILILFVFLVTSGFGCKFNPFKKVPKEYKPVTLEYWGVWDTQKEINQIIQTYESTHPTVSINYKNFRYDEYEDKLLEGWAFGNGPDLFAVPVSWLKKYKEHLEPMPSSTKIPVQETKGTIKKEIVTVLKAFKGLSPYDIKQQYVPIVYDNVVMDNKIYGLPYYLDSLVTFYNSDLLIKAGIPEPIEDFHDLVEQTPKLTKADQSGYIYQSAVALGGTHNIPRFFDIFSSIMLQNGVQVKGSSFDPLEDRNSEDRLLGTFGFYTDFVKPGMASYSWTKDNPNAFEMFINGRLAYFFGYSYHADDLRERGVQFQWDITNFPQTRGAEGTKYYANYWVNVVFNGSSKKSAAWNFIQSSASKNTIKDFLTTNKKPTALKSLINNQLEDNNLKIFASQVLTADNWYNGYDFELAEQYTAEIIDGITEGRFSIGGKESVLELFVNRINQTYKK